ncbi:MAG: UDP-N-acetylmuramoyl-tripeptide--D-alanyl-D-alanine ligase [Firmicutes bacterium]|nr:UDP-N-acetylmuramoyl-tripeptide--D-alanyl-D-alanine ligase [Bacillota bacterium]
MTALQITIAIVSSMLLTAAAQPLVRHLQLGSYSTKTYIRTLKSGTAAGLIFLCYAAYIPLYVCSAVFDAPLKYIGAALYFALLGGYIWCILKAKSKTPLKLTYRAARLFTAVFILWLAVSFTVLLAVEAYWPVFTLPILSVFPALNILIAAAANLCMAPIEYLVRQKFIRRARKKLAAVNPVNICITGSYGKTSVKFILYAMLKDKFHVCCPPKSYNTEMGLCRVINEQLKADDQILIAEMGARRKGNIAALCKLVKPDTALVTGVTEQHLEGFKTLENIVRTKYEIVEALAPGGRAVFNGESEPCRAMFARTSGNKCLVTSGAAADGEAGVRFGDVAMSPRGTEFTMQIRGELPTRCFAPLLGRHNVVNICMAAAAAHDLGLKPDEIQRAVSALMPAEHRLSVIESGKYTILDDSFSSNQAGARAALDVLADFPAPRVIITPGIVEGGTSQTRLNRELGAYFYGRADYAILTGPNTESLRDGAMTAGFDEHKIRLAASLDDSVAILPSLTDGGTVLFENDLPDNF